MKHLYSLKAIKIVTIFIVLGGAFLIYFYDIDGQVFNKPIVFTDGVDPHNLQTEKASYAPGETPKVRTAFCKTRPASAVIQWTLVDGQITFFAPKAASNVPVGCYPIGDSEKRTEATTEAIPVAYAATCDAYFVGVAKVDIGGGREVTYNYRTKPFCIK